MFGRYDCIRQRDITDCGAACLATISKHYGLRTTITKIREAACINREGTNAYGVIKAAGMLGFNAKGVRCDKQAFFTKYPLPCIAHTVVNGSQLHYVVIHKITDKQVILADPGKGIVKLTPEEFFGEKAEDGKAPTYLWTGVLILMVPNRAYEKSDDLQKEPVGTIL